MRRRLRAGALVMAGVLAWSGRADGLRTTQETTTIFVCGEDERVPPIPLHWTNVVLAGDGRLYTPCGDGAHAPDHREVREAVVIGAGRYSPDRELRWRAAQAQARNSAKPVVFPDILGRNPPPAGSIESLLAPVDGLGGLITGLTVLATCNGEVQFFDGAASPRRWQPGRLFRMLQEARRFAWVGERPAGPIGAPVDVALEGAYAIGVLLSRPELDTTVVTAATRELRACLSQTGGGVASLLLENLGLARYGKEDEFQEAVNFLTWESHGAALKTLGIVKGLEALVRQHPQHQIGEHARLRLRQLATYGDRTSEPLALDTDARIRRLALLALQAARDRDYSTLRSAAADRDWQVRRLVAASLNLSDPPMAALGDLLAADTAFQVRYELLSPLSHLASQTRDCTPIVARFMDPSPAVAMRAMDVLPTTCTGLDEVAEGLIELAGRLGDVRDDRNWHLHSRALTTLARIRPADARPLLPAAVSHPVWQVRAAAAAASAVLTAEASATTLAGDPEPNVQTAALDALFRLRSAAAVPHAIAALKIGTDHQLLLMAALVLRGLPAEAKDEASDALLIALRRLTAQEADTSRDARVAILDGLAEALSPVRASDLLPFVVDYDDAVRAAATKTFTAIAQTAPPTGALRRRYPFQPPPDALSSLPNQAVIQLEEGTVTLRLLQDVAPVTVARFAALAEQGYYDGLTFHRVVPNALVQGGSPGANDYTGVARFMRDEVGPQAVHVRGAVGMSNRGQDTGDGQFFIDLVDLPHLDRAYTVFAYVTQGMEFVDRLLEGAKIVKVSVR